MVVWIASERYGGSVLDDKAKSLVTRLIRDYYSSATVAPPDIARREFGFGEFDKKISYRHMSFKDVPALARYLVESAPPFVSYSSAEYKDPSARPIENKGFIGAELVFDLDANDLNLKCTPSHPSFWVCPNCLESVKAETIRLVEDFLIPDFGFSEKDIRANFSGNRGYHIHISSEEVMGLDRHARRSITKYISGIGLSAEAFFPTIGIRGVQLRGPKPSDYGWGGKISNAFVKALNEGTDSVVGLGIERPIAARLVKKRSDVIFGITTGNWDKVSIPKKAEFWENVVKSIAISQSDSIDSNVTNDPSHLIRLPGTIHGDTGLVAKEVGILGLNRFDPTVHAIAFQKGTITVQTGEVPEFSMQDQSFGPYKEGSTVELPTAVGVYLVLKKTAQVK
jgi:DNA primase small subunit